MTEQELREKIMAKFIEYDAWDEDDKVRLRETYTDEILSLIHEAGWRSPEEWNKNEVKWFNIVSKRKPQ